ncbi:MAG TPA: tRNA (cytidine(56)-2'-O)-methyltransferase [Candidatus Woesearchaeota archaeon]|nr:tRNA (cytidine(56)-2'-O)-methyltransferase [Candidatus Woesearchaeota archaeon]
MKVTVLRLGHRHERDKRLTSHVALTARALGADEIVISGEYDLGILTSIKDVAKRWGGSFKVSYNASWKSMVKKFMAKKAQIIHLTMYGLPYQTKLDALKKSKKDKLIIVGSEKVPSEIYDIADFNLGVTSQPHSEAAALAVFLHDLFGGRELKKQFRNAELKIIPQKKGKKVVRK